MWHSTARSTLHKWVQHSSYYYYYYYKRIWLECHKIRWTGSTVQWNEQNRGIVRHSLDQNTGRKVLLWDAAWKLSVTSTRWRWMADCSRRAKPLPEMRDRQWTVRCHFNVIIRPHSMTVIRDVTRPRSCNRKCSLLSFKQFVAERSHQLLIPSVKTLHVNYCIHQFIVL